MRFYLFDRITKLEPGHSIEGIKNWTLTEDIFNDHFPGAPIVPGVCITESMAQLMGALLEHSYADKFPDDKIGTFAVLSIIHKAKFKKFVIPGDQMLIKGTLGTLDRHSAHCSVAATVDGDIRAQADLSFQLLPKNLFPNPQLQQARDSFYNFVKNAHHLIGPK